MNYLKSEMDFMTSHDAFPPTSLNLLESLRSGDVAAREISLARFCTTYFPAIYSHARALGLQRPEAVERTRDFFVVMIEEGLLSRFEPGKGKRLSQCLMERFGELLQDGRPPGASLNQDGEFDARHAEENYTRTKLEPGPAFDLALAQGLWAVAKSILRHKHKRGGYAGLVEDLLPNVLAEDWPPPPSPTLEMLAEKHGMTAQAVRNFFNRTLRRRARRAFDDELMNHSPGCTEDDQDHFWRLLCRYGEAM